MRARDISLKARLGLGAGIIALVAILASAAMIGGALRAARLIDEALAAERRVQRYSVLAGQASALIVVGLEAERSATGGRDLRERLEPLASALRQTFADLRGDLDAALGEAEGRGIDLQSRRATQSLLVARMEAVLQSALAQLADRSGPGLRPVIDGFSQALDPLLNEAVAEEMRTRQAALDAVDTLTRRLILVASVLAAAAVALVLVFHFGILVPQTRRLTRLRDAAGRIGRQDFSVALPEDSADEIGLLARETNASAAALAASRDEVERQWARLSETIAEQTAELSEKNRRLAEIDADRRRFFADVGHELRTPLTVILMEAEIGMQSRVPGFAAIHKRAQGLIRRMDDLLRIARSESGQLDLETAPFDLRQTIEGAAQETRGAAERAGVRLEAEDGPPLCVTGDANWTRQVIAALVGNAVRHAAGATEIRIAACSDGAHARLTVSDDGAGMTPDAADRAFDRFSQGASERRKEGFGIGLSLAKWIVERQGGRIFLASPGKSGKGVEVTILLPRPPA